MKRILTLLTATLCVTASVRSQTFHHLYGDPGGNEFAFGSCLSSFSGSQSHCITGRHLDTRTDISVTCIAVARPDLNGLTVNPDNFQKYYKVFDNQMQPCHAQGLAITEFDDNGRPGFGITGVFVTPTGSEGIFVMSVDEFGTLLMFKAFEFLNVSGERPSAITYGPVDKRFVITGMVPAQFPNDPTDVFVTAADVTTGNPVATYLLDVMPNPICMKQKSNDEAFDILTDPYTTGRDQYYIVGRCNDQFGQVMGFLLGIDNTINPNMLQLYTTGNVNTQVEFYSISPAPNTNYIIGGRFGETGGDDDALVVRIDRTGKIVWNNRFDYGPRRGANNVCRDVRAVRSEFWAVGVVEDGFFGKKDIHALHLDSKGVGLSGGDITYGSPTDDFPTGVETLHGLYFLGCTSTNVDPDLYMIHPNSSGLGTCRVRTATPVSAKPTISPYHSNWWMIPFVLNVDIPPFSIIEGQFGDVNLCSSSPGARTAAPENTGVLYPNPASDRFALRLNGSAATIIVCDMSGRIVHREEAAAGVGIVEVEVTKWSAGTYLVQVIETGGNRQVLKLAVSH